MASTRVSQVGVEVAYTADNATTITQWGVEAVNRGTTAGVISQVGIESANHGPTTGTVSQWGVEYVNRMAAVALLTQWGVEVPHGFALVPSPVVAVWYVLDADVYPPWPVVTESSDTTRRIIRRLRQSPHLSDEQRWLHYSRLQLDLEAGQGLTTGQGVDPQIMLQWSDDGGRTWSNEHWVSAGPLGAYKFRAIWRRLGRSRNRVWRLVQSDATKVAWIDAFMSLDQGTS